MLNIVSNLSVLLLLISCTIDKTKHKDNAPTLNYEQYIPELSGKLNEISGLLIYDELYWGFNDSGGQPVLYGFNKKGKIKREVEIENGKNRDWESITQDKKHIYIGDFGNNMGARDNLRIYKVDKKDIKDKEEQKVEASKIEFSYGNQDRFAYFDKTTPFDCEAMVEFKDKLYLFSKNWNEYTTVSYQLPTKKGSYTIQPIDTFNVDGLITGADISPNKKQLVLVGYNNYRSFIWHFSDFKNDDFFNGKSDFYWLKGLTNAQTEGICFLNNDSILISCERAGSFKEQVFLVPLNQ